MYTRLRFDLVNSVFENRPDSAGGARVVTDVGTESWLGYQKGQAEAAKLTPWLRGADPTAWFRSYDRVVYDELARWNWRVRFDVLTGYMELNHTWYCDDKDTKRP